MNESEGGPQHDPNEPPRRAPRKEPGGEEISGRQVYNVVSDTVGGVNFRLSDNLIQAVSIAVCLVLGALIGALVTEERLLGAMAGAFIGLLVGLFGSGIFLMIFRAVMHLRGRHD